MQTVTVVPRKFTYLRNTTKTQDKESFRQHTEIEGSVVAHVIFISHGADGMTVQFCKITDEGEVCIIKAVSRIIEIDLGTIITEAR